MWPIFRIDNPKIMDARFGNELRTFNESRSPWSHHQLIVPDPFALTHVCYFFVKIDPQS